MSAAHSFVHRLRPHSVYRPCRHHPPNPQRIRTDPVHGDHDPRHRVFIEKIE